MGQIMDLYHNACSYSESFGFPHYAEWAEVRSELKEVIEELSADLNDTQKKRLQAIDELYVRSSSLELERMFLHGFRQGARLIMDVVAE